MDGRRAHRPLWRRPPGCAIRCNERGRHQRACRRCLVPCRVGWWCRWHLAAIDECSAVKRRAIEPECGSAEIWAATPRPLRPRSWARASWLSHPSSRPAERAASSRAQPAVGCRAEGGAQLAARTALGGGAAVGARAAGARGPLPTRHCLPPHIRPHRARSGGADAAEAPRCASRLDGSRRGW